MYIYFSPLIRSCGLKKKTIFLQRQRKKRKLKKKYNKKIKNAAVLYTKTRESLSLSLCAERFQLKRSHQKKKIPKTKVLKKFERSLCLFIFLVEIVQFLIWGVWICDRVSVFDLN